MYTTFGSWKIIVEGTAILKTSKSDFHTASIYWNNFLDQYWRDFYLSRAPDSTEKIPTSFGLIVITPAWELLEINKEDFLKSSRKQFQLMDGAWTTDALLPI